MFRYELVYDVSSDQNVGNIKNSDNYCLLIPELIKDTFDKINVTSIPLGKSDFVYNGKFKNGYAIFCSGKEIERIVREDGSIIEFPKAFYIKLYSDYFSDDRLLVAIDDEYAYIDGISGKIIWIPEQYQSNKLSNYVEGYAISTYFNTRFYFDKDFKRKSPEYEYASPFINGRALVCTKTEWQFVDKDFNILLAFSRMDYKDDLFKNLLHDIEVDVEKTIKEANIRECNQKFGLNRAYFNNDTGISIFMPRVLEKLAQNFSLELPNLSIKEQLIWLVDEIAKKGTFVYNTSDGKITPVELKIGIKISSYKDNVISYDKEDVAYLRQRIKKESLDE